MSVFSEFELKSTYSEFEQLLKHKKLDNLDRRWLGDWKLWDLACSPMDDSERSLIRYGHYLGFYCNLASTENLGDESERVWRT